MITIIETGFYHPSQANWSYHIFMVIDELGACLYSSTFGGDYRLVERLEKEGKKVKRSYVNASAKFSWSDVRKMQDIEKYGKEGGNE